MLWHWVSEILCFSLTHSARQHSYVSAGVAKRTLTISNLYFVITPHSFVIQLWNIIVNPQAFVPGIHRVLRCSFSWVKLQHISESPYTCNMYFLPDTHYKNSGTHHYVPWCLVRLHKLQKRKCLLMPSWRDALPRTWRSRHLSQSIC